MILWLYTGCTTTRVGFDRVALGLGPPLFILAADDVHDDHLRLLRRHCAIASARTPACPHQQFRVRARADRRAAEARPGSAPVWDTRGGLVPGPDRDKREQRKKREGGNWQGQQQRGWGSAYSLGAAAAVVNVEREARTVNPLEHLPKVRVP